MALNTSVVHVAHPRSHIPVELLRREHSILVTMLVLMVAPVSQTQPGEFPSPSKSCQVSFLGSECSSSQKAQDSIACATMTRVELLLSHASVKPILMMTCSRKSTSLSRLKSCSSSPTTAKSSLERLVCHSILPATLPSSRRGLRSSAQLSVAVSCSSNSSLDVMVSHLHPEYIVTNSNTALQQSYTTHQRSSANWVLLAKQAVSWLPAFTEL
jgi:hypothetical protein